MSTPYFLSRPRRFGKSLLLSTLEAYFLGKKELFRGLAIEHLEKEWTLHAVLHLDLNAEKYDSPERLADMLERQLKHWEEQYETGGVGGTYSGRFMEVIRSAYKKTGRGVVVLIDEYDKPLLRSFHDEKLQRDFRETLTAFYTVLKDADPWLRFVFITGATKFAQMGIFSSLNQLKDISLDPRYASLCGMTRNEIEKNFVTPFYTSLKDSETSFYIGKFVKELRAGKVDDFMSRLRAFFADFPYELNTKTERHYQVVFYLVFKLMGQFAEVEVKSAAGRADAVVKTPDYIYVFEFKLHGTAEEALQQIDDRGYLIPYQADNRVTVKVGVEFNAEERNIGRWIGDTHSYRLK